MVSAQAVCLTEDTATRLRQALLSRSIRAANEIALQDQVEAALQACGWAYEREKRLGPAERPDFFLPGSGIAVEVKLKFPRAQIIRQVVRYLARDEVNGVILVAVKGVDFPEECATKPVREVVLWQGMIM